MVIDTDAAKTCLLIQESGRVFRMNAEYQPGEPTLRCGDPISFQQCSTDAVPAA